LEDAEGLGDGVLLSILTVPSKVEADPPPIPVRMELGMPCIPSGVPVGDISFLSIPCSAALEFMSQGV